MTATRIDGKALAQTLQAEIATRARAFEQTHGVRPGLAAVLVGDRPDSQTYVASKRKACEKAGFNSWLHTLPATARAEELLALIRTLNADPAVHGILVQMPLPPQIPESVALDAVHPLKDVDGFGAENLGLLVQGRPRYLACTPAGIHQLLLRNGIALPGKHVVVLGRSTIVGKPIALILMQKGREADCTVTVCHSRTPDIGAMTRQADVLIAAIGQPRFVKADMVKPGAVVIDVGINRLPEGRLVGDVDFEAVEKVAGAITPVPGGVGPMTITMLLDNTLRAAQVQVAGEVAP